ncbi:hypothetical protein GCM10009584_10740 [Ornithinimicrobium humiphilum]|uniref:Glycosyltransferase involved in cell wall biosynthesis n=1 Tax=Ornithinimicrobium humiphilum TaxID=125288 RepID=A0A543KJD4_9MICO|nr:glycosyltransferase family 4 protein [Ornithinimicrobium humiphilum]TQM95183.1 hypothetical protein FB476_0016 [Ornithinimicrobium humiphilum]
MVPPAAPDPSPAPARDLVVCFAFAPFVDTAAIVAAKRVREEGRPVDLVTNDMSSQRPQDPALEVIAGDLVRRRATLPTPTWFSSWKAVEGFTVEGLPRALEWDADGPGYERLYSRAHWVPSHVLAARFKSERPHVRWTAEFSDPLSVYVDARERHTDVVEGELLDQLRADLLAVGVEPPGDNLFRWVETLPYALADELLFTNARQRDLMLSRIEDEALADRARERSVVRPHPTLPPEFYRIASPKADLDPDRRHIAYFGNFYATRGMSTVLSALAALPQELRDRLQLHVHTGQQDDLLRSVEAAGLQDVVRVAPFVGFLDFLALSARMDVLIVNDAITEGTFPVNPFLPSKWSDYRGSGREVWGIVEPGSPLSEQDLDHRTPVRHVSAAVQVLAEIARG